MLGAKEGDIKVPEDFTFRIMSREDSAFMFQARDRVLASPPGSSSMKKTGILIPFHRNFPGSSAKRRVFQS